MIVTKIAAHASGAYPNTMTPTKSSSMASASTKSSFASWSNYHHTQNNTPSNYFAIQDLEIKLTSVSFSHLWQLLNLNISNSKLIPNQNFWMFSFTSKFILLWAFDLAKVFWNESANSWIETMTSFHFINLLSMKPFIQSKRHSAIKQRRIQT